MDLKNLNHEIGNIDLYWLDFILKGYLSDSDKILDAGCGEGRNLYGFLRNRLDVFGVDQNPDAIQLLKLVAKQFQMQDLDARFQVMKLEKMLFPDASFDVIICSAVLHFAQNDEHFNSITKELIRLLKPSGKLFIRTMTDRFLPSNAREIGVNMFEIYDQQVRYVVNANAFVDYFKKQDFELIEPYKEVVVQEKHSMGTFMLQKNTLI